MIGILFGILKIIGFMLLLFLLFLFVVILSILLIPVTYSLEGEKWEKIRANAVVKWFFGAVFFHISYEDKLDICFKIFGITIWDTKTKKKRKKKRKRVGKTAISSGTAGPVKKPIHSMGEEDHRKQTAQEKKEQLPKLSKELPESKFPVQENMERPYESDLQKQWTEPKGKEEKEIPLERPRIRRVKLSEIPEVLPEPVQEGDEAEEEESIPKKEKSPIADYLIKMSLDEKKHLISLIFRFLKRILKGVLPKERSGYIVVGTEDPALTGYILGLSAALAGVLGENFVVKGFFQGGKLEGNIQIKGKITIIVFVYAILCFIVTKPVRKVIKILWKGNDTNGK